MEEVNKGGRPRIYDDTEEDAKVVEELCEEYFNELKHKNQNKEPADQFIPPTVTGLALYLGFDSKSTLYEYSKRHMFSHPIKRALTKVENYHEVSIAYGEKCTGNIFALKNMGWQDTVKQEVDHTTKGEKMQSVPVFGTNPLDNA